MCRRPASLLTLNHPYGHRKYETLAAVVIFVFLLVIVIEVVRSAVGRLLNAEAPEITRVSFRHHARHAGRQPGRRSLRKARGGQLASEVLHADALHTRSDVLTSIAVLGALLGVKAGYPMARSARGPRVAGFIGKAGFDIARKASRILADEIVMAEDDLREIVMSVSGVLGCHHLRTRGSADHAFLDLHIWLKPDTRLDEAHRISHVVKDRLMARYPQIVDAVIHIEPPPASWSGGSGREQPG